MFSDRIWGIRNFRTFQINRTTCQQNGLVKMKMSNFCVLFLPLPHREGRGESLTQRSAQLSFERLDELLHHIVNLLIDQSLLDILEDEGDSV